MKFENVHLAFANTIYFGCFFVWGRQSNEVGGSQHMEEEGLRRSLALLEERGISLDCIVTERHPQIQKFLSEMNFTHHYDVCHIAKGIFPCVHVHPHPQTST